MKMFILLISRTVLIGNAIVESLATITNSIVDSIVDSILDSTGRLNPADAHPPRLFVGSIFIWFLFSNKKKQINSRDVAIANERRNDATDFCMLSTMKSFAFC